MSIVNWFENNLDAEERVITRDLISVAIADKEFDESELITIWEICKEEGISDVEMMDSVRNKDDKHLAEVFRTKEDKKKYLMHLIYMVAADGNYSPLEMHVVEIIARKLGFSSMQMLMFVLDDIDEGLFSSEEGLVLMKNFLKHFISIENN